MIIALRVKERRNHKDKAPSERRRSLRLITLDLFSIWKITCCKLRLIRQSCVLFISFIYQIKVAVRGQLFFHTKNNKKTTVQMIFLDKITVLRYSDKLLCFT